MKFIPYGRQHITDSDIEAVVNVLKSDFITQGPEVEAFENKIGEIVGSKYCLAMNSATSALHVAIKALGVGKGDYVWTSPITFVASANCALYEGASIDFVDVDPQTYNFSVTRFKEKLTLAKKEGRIPKVIIVVHFSGQSCDMSEISALCKEFDIKIIEDASHAIGGRYKDTMIGSCRYSDITIFSFHPVKIVTTGEGGVAVTNEDLLAEKMELFRSHGVTRKQELLGVVDEGGWYYEQVDLGFNYRMTDIQASLGRSQLNRLSQYIERRHEVATFYHTTLKDSAFITPMQIETSYSAYHLYVIRVDRSKTNKSRREIFDYLRSKGVGVNVHYIPVHTQPYYRELGFKEGMFPNAEAYYESAISLPMFPTITDEELRYVVATLKESLL
ncbi:MAG: UDP-4-amino-4,6-dideoxy-N-acetyl-beta-L-altrosamine transaminase [Halobacteriovoraceae bacterium]|nr:UDP-4-amino-4,6-dideoxy-N-acetyl-beta-L-altrosamine transaminase [Halobacteriovoraceae bacterium]|tara:strand:+ start:14874 stop:16037 length:1164 start_codon:yes stop_codon:yes gene_type:complete